MELSYLCVSLAASINATWIDYRLKVLLVFPTSKTHVTSQDIVNASYLIPLRRRTELWLLANFICTWEGEDGLERLARLLEQEDGKTKRCARRFLG